jgi:hypothetical protein
MLKSKPATQQLQQSLVPSRPVTVAQALFERAPTESKLGPWLVSLPCEDYAFFMEAMYGGTLGGIVIVERV